MNKTMKTLIKMEDYVLWQNESDDKQVSMYFCIEYAKLLKSKPTLGQFVPTDDEGNVFKYTSETGHNAYDREYQTALDKVIFDGWSIESNEEYFKVLSQQENRLTFFKRGSIYFNGIYINTSPDLTQFNLKLK